MLKPKLPPPRPNAIGAPATPPGSVSDPIRDDFDAEPEPWHMRRELMQARRQTIAKHTIEGMPPPPEVVGRHPANGNLVLSNADPRVVMRVLTIGEIREYAARYAKEMIEHLVDIARYSDSDMVRVAAIDKVLARGAGASLTFTDIQKLDKGTTSMTWIDMVKRAAERKQTGLPPPEIVPTATHH